LTNLETWAIMSRSLSARRRFVNPYYIDMNKIRIKEHDGYYFSYDENDPSVPVTIHSNWRKTGQTPAVIDLTYSRPLKSADNRDRLYVTIATMGKKVRVYLDTLVASYLIDNPRNYNRVIHKDNNIYNCHPTNLKWVSDSDYKLFAVNINRAKGKTKQFEVVYLDGRKEIVTGFLEFLEKNNLSEESIYKLRKGEILEYNGIIAFNEIERNLKGRSRKKEELKIDLSGYDTVELDDWPGYYIVYKKDDPSEQVRIFSKWKPVKNEMVLSENFVRETSQHVHKTGYYQLNMKLPGEKKIIQKLHRLIAKQLVENSNPDEFDTVDHIDNNKQNNHPSNLQWMTSSANSAKGGDPETMYYVAKQYEVTYVDETKEIFVNLNMFCRERGYSRGSLWSMIQGKQHKHKNIVKITKL